MSPFVLFWLEVKNQSVQRKRYQDIVFCSSSNWTPRDLEIPQCHQAHPAFGTHQTQNALQCQPMPASRALSWIYYPHTPTHLPVSLSGNPGRQTPGLGFITALPSHLVQMNQDILGSSKAKIHLSATVFQNLLSGKDISRKQTQTPTHTHS